MRRLLAVGLLFAICALVISAQVNLIPTGINLVPEKPVHAQVSGTPAIQESDSEVFVIEDLEPFEGKLDPPAYPGLDTTLNRLVRQVGEGYLTAHSAAQNVPVGAEESVGVIVHIRGGIRRQSK